MSDSTRLLQTRQLAVHAGARCLLSALELTVIAGSCVGVLGRNGTGKTSLLHTLAGLRQPAGGEVLLRERSLSQWPRRALAQELGILFQHHHDDMPATVLETALLGRLPHSKPWQWERAADAEIARQALAALDLATLAERQVSTLSGGERQRLALAVLLTQDPALLLLDEPGNHLDAGVQLRTLQLLRERLQQRPSALLFATHDINLAARFCDQVLLLAGDGSCLLGPVEEILNEQNLSRTYDCDIRAIDSEFGRYFVAV